MEISQLLSCNHNFCSQPTIIVNFTYISPNRRHTLFRHKLDRCVQRDNKTLNNLMKLDFICIGNNSVKRQCFLFFALHKKYTV